MHRRRDITGLVLAGGAARRMHGADKGLVPWQGTALVDHALQRLQPQVGPLMVSANRNRAAYRREGVSVVGDEPLRPATDVTAHPERHPGNQGPLAGWRAGLRHCRTPWLLTVPCDSPLFPADLASRLHDAIQAQACDAAVVLARSWPRGADDEPGRLSMQPLFCLLASRLAPSLDRFLAAGGLQVRQWLSGLRCASVPFDDAIYGPLAFANANSADDLQRLSQLHQPPLHEPHP